MSNRAHKPLSLQFLRHEQLEARNLLAGHAIASALAGAGADFFAAAANQVNHTIAPAVQAAHNEIFGQFGSDLSSAKGAAFTASLTDSAGGTGTASVTYNAGTVGGTGVAVLSITGDTSQEGDTESVTIGGTSVGNVTIDGSGSGTLVVPTATLAAAVAANTSIGVGSLTGSFAASTSTGGTSGDCSGAHDNGGFTASVTDGTNTATVTYQTGKLLGTTESVITVTGDTSAAGTSVPVTIGGTAVGNVAINSSGTGTLIVPTSTLTSAVAASTSVGIGGLTGTFAASTTTTTSSHAGFTSALTDVNGDTASLTVQTGKLLGTSETVVKVSGDTADEGTNVALVIGTNSLGSISIDSTGSGTLIVPTASITTALASGNAVALGGFSGTLAVNTSSSGSHGFWGHFRR